MDDRKPTGWITNATRDLLPGLSELCQHQTKRHIRLVRLLPLSDLEQERKLSPMPPLVVGGALVVPIGLLQRL